MYLSMFRNIRLKLESEYKEPQWPSTHYKVAINMSMDPYQTMFIIRTEMGSSNKSNRSKKVDKTPDEL